MCADRVGVQCLKIVERVGPALYKGLLAEGSLPDVKESSGQVVCHFVGKFEELLANSVVILNEQVLVNGKAQRVLDCKTNESGGCVGGHVL